MRYYMKLCDTQIDGTTKAKRFDGKWCNARPKEYDGGFILRLRKAFDVLTGKASALYWEIEMKEDDAR